jgi:hypothetical protein
MNGLSIGIPTDYNRLQVLNSRAMTFEDDILRYWEEKTAWHEQRWQSDWGHNMTMGSSIYWKDVAPYKSIVRAVRLKAGIPICWGAPDCLEQSLAKCAAGEHEACARHKMSCFLCKA